MKAKALAVLLVVALLLSGCASKKDKDGDGGSTSTTSTTGTSTSKSGSASATGTGSAAPGAITASLTRSTPNGAAPLEVNFTLSAKFVKGGKDVPAPAGTSWSVKVAAGNGTNATDGPKGTSLPANFTLNFTAGNHTVTATVSAPGFTAGNATVLVAASGGPAAAVPLFFDGAEGDASQFTISSNVWFYDVFTGTEQETPAPYPETAWAASADAAHSGTKSWFSSYPDNYRTRMETVTVKVPAAATLTYWVKGGAEGNGVDGLHVIVNGAEVALHNNVPEWTMFSAPVAAGDAKVLFRFDSDAGCSDQSPPAGDPSGMVCGAGYDLGGIYVDDIQIA